MKVIRDLILARPIVEEKSGGIIIPDSAQVGLLRADVVKVGSGHLTEAGIFELEVKVGDVVLYEKFSGTRVTIDDEEFIILKEEEILLMEEKDA